MKTHIVEQDRDGMIIPIKTVWLVLQTQPSSDYERETIAVFTDEEDAVSLARRLNKVYGAKNCHFDEDWDFIDYEGCYDCCHYYEVESIELNPDPEDYLWSTMED